MLRNEGHKVKVKICYVTIECLKKYEAEFKRILIENEEI